MLRAFAVALLFLPSAMACADDDPAPSDVVKRHPRAFTVAAEPVTVTLDVAAAKGRLLEAAKSATETVVLRIEGVSAEKAPGFIVAVFVGEVRVGEVALYTYEPPQSFAFAADDAIVEAMRGGGRVAIRFEPESGVDGQPARPAAPVRISALSLFIERQ